MLFDYFGGMVHNLYNQFPILNNSLVFLTTLKQTDKSLHISIIIFLK